jgi:MFS-type transporter involved in bile tolerance (Atg22 family)
LVPDAHEDFGLQATWDDDAGHYTIEAVNSPDIAQDPDDEEQEWARTHLGVLPLEVNEYITAATTYEWSENGLNTTDVVAVQTLLDSISDTRFSMSISGGILDSKTNIGEGHPTTLGDGMLDFVPTAARDNVWEPLGISVTFQFLLLGVMAGALLGGSQGLSRSMFGQMVPETRSAEFFGFFGFFGKVAALIGPLLYAVMTVTFDSRVGIFSISLLIIAGAILLRKVDVEDGIEVANAEDARNRAASVE